MSAATASQYLVGTTDRGSIERIDMRALGAPTP
jgi:hypothetical protein